MLSVALNVSEPLSIPTETTYSAEALASSSSMKRSALDSHHEVQFHTCEILVDQSFDVAALDVRTT